LSCLSIYLKVLRDLILEDPRLVNKLEVVLKVPEPIGVPKEVSHIVKVVSGWLDRRELIELYQSSDIVVVPSLSEGFSISIIEALQHASL